MRSFMAFIHNFTQLYVLQMYNKATENKSGRDKNKQKYEISKFELNTRNKKWEINIKLPIKNKWPNLASLLIQIRCSWNIREKQRKVVLL